MDLYLERNLFKEDGIYGGLYTLDRTFVCYTLEHSYDLKPKVPEGEYECVRGMHYLGSGPLETFEVSEVPGHTGILFHPGNTEKDSEGCILLGMQYRPGMILRSKVAFQAFMALQKGLEEFLLIIENKGKII